MNADEIVRALKEMLPPQVDYAELVCEAMISPYKQVMIAANEHDLDRHKEVERLESQLSASQHREKAAVEDLTKLATKPITPCHSCAKTCVFPASLAPECQPPTWCREWQWRGPQEAVEGEQDESSKS